MIYRLQRKFIFICAASIFGVIILVYVFFGIFSFSAVNKTLDTLTDGISLGNGRFTDFFEKVFSNFEEHGKNPGISSITPETRFSTRHFTVWFDEDKNIIQSNTESIFSVNENKAEDFAEKALNRRDRRGWISSYRYKVYDTENGTAVVFVDGTTQLTSLLQSLTIAGIVLMVSSLLVLFLIVILSNRVMKPVAQSYEKQKQFVTDANHELKTPLTLILTNLDIAESELGKNEWLDDIRFEGQRMTELVNQLVSLSRMDEEQAINKTELRISDMVMDTVSEFETLAANRGKKLIANIDLGITYTGDEALLRRLVAILLDNAVKYCDEGGDIFVSFKKHRHIVLTVENTYHAVDSVELEKLFDRFYRADKARTYTGSFGIGLSIAKSITQKHHGEIAAYRKCGTHIGFRVVLKP